MRILQASEEPGSFFCFELTDKLSPTVVTFSGLGEPSQARFDILLASTLAAGTTVIRMDTEALVKASVEHLLLAAELLNGTDFSSWLVLGRCCPAGRSLGSTYLHEMEICLDH